MQDYTSKQERMSVAQRCPEYRPISREMMSSNNLLSCEQCKHWDDGKCKIYDDVVSTIPETWNDTDGR
ncbi:MAG: hypothetical protein PHP06_01735 [Clostridia bacterium]|nr:hypothetical protein [Clostridia bacterium]